MRLNIVYSTQHWIMPNILIAILIGLGAFIFITEGMGRMKKGGSFLPKFGGNFFQENYNKVQFWGCIALIAAYFFCLPIIGFTFGSIIFLTLLNTLFAGMDRIKNVRYHINSVLISTIAVVLISVMFGTIFAITLPSGFATIEIQAWNFNRY